MLAGTQRSKSLIRLNVDGINFLDAEKVNMGKNQGLLRKLLSALNHELARPSNLSEEEEGSKGGGRDGGRVKFSG